jgi:hypothetical protein
MHAGYVSDEWPPHTTTNQFHDAPHSDYNQPSAPPAPNNGVDVNMVRGMYGTNPPGSIRAHLAYQHARTSMGNVAAAASHRGPRAIEHARTFSMGHVHVDNLEENKKYTAFGDAAGNPVGDHTSTMDDVDVDGLEEDDACISPTDDAAGNPIVAAASNKTVKQTADPKGQISWWASQHGNNGGYQLILKFLERIHGCVALNPFPSFSKTIGVNLDLMLSLARVEFDKNFPSADTSKLPRKLVVTVYYINY